MSAIINAEVTVERDAARLIAFSWQGQRYPVTSVQILGTPPTRWWDGEGERTYVRVAVQRQLYELYFDHQRKTWVLARKL